MYQRAGSEAEISAKRGTTSTVTPTPTSAEEQKTEVVQMTIFGQIGYYITELFQCSGCCCSSGCAHHKRGESNMKQSHMEMKFQDDELASSSPETNNENYYENNESFVMLS